MYLSCKGLTSMAGRLGIEVQELGVEESMKSVGARVFQSFRSLASESDWPVEMMNFRYFLRVVIFKFGAAIHG